MLCCLFGSDFFNALHESRLLRFFVGVLENIVFVSPSISGQVKRCFPGVNCKSMLVLLYNFIL